MNYYEHHIGDFRSGTVNMTRTERWIYRDLIEVYYDTEKPLTADVEKLCKDIGVRADDEKAVVRELLAYKFTLTERGYEHERCESVISDYRARAETARENGKKGGRPPKNRNENPEKPSGFPEVSESNQGETGSKTNHKPLTTNQKPGEKAKASRAVRAARPQKSPLPADFSISDRVRAWAHEKGHARLEDHFEAFVRKSRARGYQYVDWDDAFMEAIREDWAGLRKQHSQGPPTLNRQEALEARNREIAARVTAEMMGAAK